MASSNVSEISGLRLNYGFRTRKAILPFIEVQHQDLMITMGTGGGEKETFNLRWTGNEYEMVRYINLPIDQRYLVSLRIVGKQTVPYISSVNKYNKVTINSSLVTIDCPQANLMTWSWQCENGASINASAVCNLQRDCTDNSDEQKVLCKGTDPRYLKITKYVSLSLFTCGFIVFLIRLLLKKLVRKKLVGNKTLEITGSMEGTAELNAETEEALNIVRKTCKQRVATRKNKLEEHSSTELESFKDFYRTKKGPDITDC